MGRSIKHGATDQSTVIRIVDSTDGTPETGVTSATSGIDLKYRREGAVTANITESDLSALNDAHADGGMLHIGAGYYRVDVPDAAFASGSDGVLIFGTVTGMIVIGEYHQLVANTEADTYARIGAPVGASISADIAAIDTGGGSGASAAGADFTNEIVPIATEKLVVFRAVLDDGSPATGKTIAITISKNGATSFSNPSVGALNATEMSSGFYKFTLSTADTGTAGPLAWRGTEGTIADAGDVYSVVEVLSLDDIAEHVVDEIDANSVAIADLPTNAELATALASADDAVLAAISGLNDISPAEVNAEVDAAIETYHLDHLLANPYDPASKPGAADALLNELIESDAGIARFTSNALEQGPAGGGGGSSAPDGDEFTYEHIPQSATKLVVFRAKLEDGSGWATGKTIPITISKNGATSFSSPSAGVTNATEMSNGWYKFTLSATDTDTVGPLSWQGTEGTIADVGNVFVVTAALAVEDIRDSILEAAVPGAYAAGTVGHKIGTYLDAQVSTRAPASTALSTDTWTLARAVGLDTTLTHAAGLVTAMSTVATQASLDPIIDAIEDINTLVLDVPTNAEFSAAVGGLNNISAAQVKTQVDTALTDIHLDHLLAADYNPAAKPGVATALLNELIESDSGVSRFSANALETAPTGSGEGGAGLDASGVRAAIGLANPDLDSQLAVIAANVSSTLLAVGDLAEDDSPGVTTLLSRVPQALTFTVAGLVDANIQRVNDVAVQGTGATGDTWRPA